MTYLPRFRGERLAKKEITILQRAADGLENSQIGREIGLQQRTVKAYFYNIYIKLGADNRTHAIAMAMRRGIIR